MTDSTRWPTTLQWLVPLALFAALSWVAVVISDNLVRGEHEVDRQRFETASTELADRILDRMNTFRTILYGASGLFGASERVTRSEFLNYISLLDLPNQVPGLQGVGYAQKIEPDNIAEHESAIRAEGFADYTVRPAGRRDEMTAIVLLEPFDDRNQRAFGYDMFSEPIRRAAMERARDSGRPSLSGPVLLLQEYGSDVQPGALLYLPVYDSVIPPATIEGRRESLQGYVYSPIRLHDFIDGLVGNSPPKLDFRLYDSNGGLGTGDLFPFSETDSGEWPSHELLDLKQSLDVYGQEWILQTRAAAPVSRHAGSQLALKAGLLIAALLALLVSVLLRLRTRAEALA